MYELRTQKSETGTALRVTNHIFVVRHIIRTIRPKKLLI